MGNTTQTPVEVDLLRRLADFRHELLGFLHFSQRAAEAVGLQPQQHQLLLHLAGAPEGTEPSIAYISERLGLRHNSTGELVDRCVESGLVQRRQDAADGRRVVVQLTEKGLSVLQRLSEDHARELNELAPRLVRSLRRIQTAATKREGKPASSQRAAASRKEKS
ncbi:MAG: MarR family winged helix-turn-helix transcriptional regulator [Acidobacteriaceae bacterium]